MLKLTDKLKAHAREKLSVAADASDDAYRKAVGEAIAEGNLDAATLADLTSDKAPKLAEVIAAEVQKAFAGLTSPQPASAALPGLGGTRLKGGGPTPANLFKPAADQAAANSNPRVEVKTESSKYSATRTAAKHAKTGELVYHEGRPVETLSEQILAKVGVWMRYKALLKGVDCRALNDHERGLLNEMFATDTFCGCKDGDPDTAPWEEAVSGMQVKALLDESGGSGGQGLVPIYYDELIVTFPLLFGELLPFVEEVIVPRGHRMVTGSLGNPTITWGTAEGTSLTLFSTTSLAAELDNTVWPAMVAVEVGIDFLSDSPVNVGEVLQNNLGMAWLKEADNVIASGNGTNQPTGILNTTSPVVIASINGTPGPLVIEDAENLIFGLAKQYRDANWMPAFVMNDVSYKRLRQIPVSAMDQRRIFGLDTQAYTLLGYPVKIQQSIANSSIAFQAMKKWRHYKRKGFDMRTVTDGQTLALKNTILIVGRARMGGFGVDGAACALMSNAMA